MIATRDASILPKPINSSPKWITPIVKENKSTAGKYALGGVANQINILATIVKRRATINNGGNSLSPIFMDT